MLLFGRVLPNRLVERKSERESEIGEQSMRLGGKEKMPSRSGRVSVRRQSRYGQDADAGSGWGLG